MADKQKQMRAFLQRYKLCDNFVNITFEWLEFFSRTAVIFLTFRVGDKPHGVKFSLNFLSPSRTRSEKFNNLNSISSTSLPVYNHGLLLSLRVMETAILISSLNAL